MPLDGTGMDMPHSVTDNHFCRIQAGRDGSLPIHILTEIGDHAQGSFVLMLHFIVPHDLCRQPVVLCIGSDIHVHRFVLHHSLGAHACLYIPFCTFHTQVGIKEMFVPKTHLRNLSVHFQQTYPAVYVSVQGSLLRYGNLSACQSAYYTGVLDMHIEVQVQFF